MSQQSTLSKQMFRYQEPMRTYNTEIKWLLMIQFTPDAHLVYNSIFTKQNVKNLNKCFNHSKFNKAMPERARHWAGVSIP